MISRQEFHAKLRVTYNAGRAPGEKFSSQIKFYRFLHHANITCTTRQVIRRIQCKKTPRRARWINRHQFSHRYLLAQVLLKILSIRLGIICGAHIKFFTSPLLHELFVGTTVLNSVLETKTSLIVCFVFVKGHCEFQDLRYKTIMSSFFF
jgi:hypothetical protein